MAKRIFINLPVKDVARSRAFFTALGFTFNDTFTSNDGACMIINHDCFVMLLQESFFRTFTAKKPIDTAHHTEAIFAFSADSRDEVDDMVNKALAAGAMPSSGFDNRDWMYQGSFQDLDGHLWEVTYMDLEAMPKN